MVEEIFASLGENFRANKVATQQVYYFSIDDVKKTVTLGPEQVLVENGNTVEAADCVCKTSAALFLKIWQEGYRPGMADFMSGTIKSNNPFALKAFLAAFDKNG
jgi:putative sterol carrier protein